MYVVYVGPEDKPQLLGLFEVVSLDSRVEFGSSIAYTEHARSIVENNSVPIKGGVFFTWGAQEAFDHFCGLIDSYYKAHPSELRYVTGEIAGVRRAFVVHLEYYGNSG